jgi:DNA (cytosine-5)-methyltransferase 1
MRAGALFAGMGGLDLAVAEVLGTDLAWYAEHEPPSEDNPRPTQAAARVMAHRFPGVPNLGDVQAVDWAAAPPVDVLTGGFPCTDVSVAGRQAGIAPGTRSGMWKRMADAIDHVRPRLVIIENVRGLTSARAARSPTAADPEPDPLWQYMEDDDEQATPDPTRDDLGPDDGDVGGGDDPGPVLLRALGAVLGDLADLGYDAAWHGIRAADIGACHGRFRVFILAWPATDPPGHGLHRPREAWTGGGGLEDGDSTAAGLTLLPTPDATHSRKTTRTSTLLPGVVELLATPTASIAKGGRPQDSKGKRDLRLDLLPTPTATPYGHQRSLSDGAAVRPSLDTLARDGTLLPTPRATDGAKGGPNQRGISGDLMLPSAVQPERWGVYAPAVAHHGVIFGRPAPEPTEAGRKGGRRLAPRFVEWMMGLPDGWVCDVPNVTRTDQLKILGNGVVPAQAAAALRYLLAVAAEDLPDPAPGQPGLPSDHGLRDPEPGGLTDGVVQGGMVRAVPAQRPEGLGAVHSGPPSHRGELLQLADCDGPARGEAEDTVTELHGPHVVGDADAVGCRQVQGPALLCDREGVELEFGLVGDGHGGGCCRCSRHAHKYTPSCGALSTSTHP